MELSAQAVEIASGDKLRQRNALLAILREVSGKEADPTNQWTPSCTDFSLIRELASLVESQGPKDPLGSRALHLIANIRAVLAYCAAPPGGLSSLLPDPPGPALSVLTTVLSSALKFFPGASEAGATEPDPRCALVLLSFVDTAVTLLRAGPLPLAKVFAPWTRGLAAICVLSEDLELTEAADSLFMSLFLGEAGGPAAAAAAIAEAGGEHGPAAAARAAQQMALKPLRPAAGLRELAAALGSGSG